MSSKSPPPAANRQPLLTYRLAAIQLGVSERTVWKLVHEGSLPSIKIGRLVRIDPTDVQYFLEQAKGRTSREES